jgi:hypothetical protein
MITRYMLLTSIMLHLPFSFKQQVGNPDSYSYARKPISALINLQLHTEDLIDYLQGVLYSRIRYFIPSGDFFYTIKLFTVSLFCTTLSMF